MINDETLSNLFDLPKEGETAYSFLLSDTLFGMMQNLVGTHEFILTVADRATSSKTAKASFKITIQEKTAE